MSNASPLEWAYTIFNAAVAVGIAYGIQRRVRKAWHTWPLSPPVFLVTLMKLLGYTASLAIELLLVLMGATAMTTPPSQAASNSVVASVFGFSLLMIGAINAAYITLDLYLQSRLDRALEDAEAVITVALPSSVVSRELMAANVGKAAAEATLAQIGVQDAKAALLAAATNVDAVSTTTTSLHSAPATETVDVIAGIDPVIPGPAE